MPEIRPSADLRNNYGEISDYCHRTGNPIYITRNGRSDLVVISSEMYDSVMTRSQEYCQIQQGKPIPLSEEDLMQIVTRSIRELQDGKSYTLTDGMAEARGRLRDV